MTLVTFGSLLLALSGRRYVLIPHRPTITCFGDVASAGKLGLAVVPKIASDMDFCPRFDAVFGNAALHWMKSADAVIGQGGRALLPNGRIVAEKADHVFVKTLT